MATGGGSERGGRHRGSLRGECQRRRGPPAARRPLRRPRTRGVIERRVDRGRPYDRDRISAGSIGLGTSAGSVVLVDNVVVAGLSGSLPRLIVPGVEEPIAAP